MADDIATLQQQLADAKAARHRLMIGEAETSIRIGDKAVTYSAVNLAQLNAYIAGLEAQLGTGRGRRSIIGVLG